MTTDMAAYWDRAGKVWVEQQALLDRIYQPVAEAVVEAADPRNGQAVLDVGCGAGATTFTGSGGVSTRSCSATAVSVAIPNPPKLSDPP